MHVHRKFSEPSAFHLSKKEQAKGTMLTQQPCVDGRRYRGRKIHGHSSKEFSKLYIVRKIIIFGNIENICRNSVKFSPLAKNYLSMAATAIEVPQYFILHVFGAENERYYSGKYFVELLTRLKYFARCSQGITCIIQGAIDSKQGVKIVNERSECPLNARKKRIFAVHHEKYRHALHS